MINRQSRFRDPLWYKDAIIYEVRLRSFYDSNADGMGDFSGLTAKLDYIQDLGVDTIWLLPFYPSPLKDDGYDISDYFNVHPHYGTLDDCREFIHQAHERGINVVTELVLNHTSDKHSWFIRAKRSKPGSVFRNFYVWSNDPTKYQEARIIFKDFERSNWTWDDQANAYFWHRFYSNQPDLNYDNPSVRKAVLEIVDFWLEMGVDGMRLDTIPYLYEREGTSCENLPETHAFVKELRLHIDQKFKNRMLLAEANQWPTDSVAYFGNGDECHMAFHFPIMPRLFMSIQLEDRFPLIDILQQTPPIPSNCQWALFLRNHDELTLEMVTDEERDYMYRTYAQDPQARLNLGIRRRLAPLLGNDRRKIELMNGILFSFPGTPIIYYGDELGMGDNIYLGDRDGVRTPMQWSPDLNAGFSRANSQRLCLPITMDSEYSYETINVENQQKNPNSLLWSMKRLIALRKRFKSFGRGTIEFLNPSNSKILAFFRRYNDELILVVANFSRFIEHVELDLSSFKGMIPYELFGRSRFPSVSEHPYSLTLGPYAYYWFALQADETERIFKPTQTSELPVIEISGTWQEVFRAPFKKTLERYLLLYLKSCPWFAEKDLPFKNILIEEKIPFTIEKEQVFLLFLRITSDREISESFALVVGFTSKDQLTAEKEAVDTSIAHLKIENEGKIVQGRLYPGFRHPDFFNILFEGLLKRRVYNGINGKLSMIAYPNLKRLNQFKKKFQSTKIESFDPSTLNITFDQDWILKIYRFVENGVNPEVEVNLFLSKKNLPFISPCCGIVEYQQMGVEPYTFAFLQKFIPNQGSAWKYTLDELDRYFERVITQFNQFPEQEMKIPVFEKMTIEPSNQAIELIGTYLERARMIGEVTAQMHLALSDWDGNPAFEPLTTTPFYLRSNFQSKRNLVVQVLQKLSAARSKFSEPIEHLVKKILDARESIIQAFEPLLNSKASVMRIRCHGEFHLGQLLFTGKEFIVTNFSSNHKKSFAERRRKRSALRDVAGLLRSLHFAAYKNFFNQKQKGLILTEKFPTNEQWPLFWQSWVSASFLKAYLKEVGNASFVPQDSLNFKLYLNAYLLERAFNDLNYELNQDDLDWLAISLQWILSILDR